MKKVFVICPSETVTGGIELLHQLVDVLRCSGEDAYISYVGKNKTIPEAYKKYNIQVSEISKDLSDAVIVLPEVYFYMLPKFKKANKIVLWWLSVDNFIKDSCSLSFLFEKKFYNRKLYPMLFFSFLKKIIKLFLLRGDLFNTISIRKFRKYNNAVYACQSQYAVDFCNFYSLKPTYLLSDFINTDFENTKNVKKSDVIIYNPKKGKRFTEKLISTNKDLTFIPIVNMNREQVKDLMFKAKVYIDYGNHPGKDRMPRESCLCNCLILTGKDGSAYNSKDIEIPDYYKDEASVDNINLISEKIHSCLTNYDEKKPDFNNYHNKILNEKNDFSQQVQLLFNDLLGEQK